MRIKSRRYPQTKNLIFFNLYDSLIKVGCYKNFYLCGVIPINIDYLKEMAVAIYGESGVHFIPDDWVSVKWGAHWHDCMELVLVTRGIIDTTINNKRFSAEAGTVIIVPPCCIHSGEFRTPDTERITMKIELRNFLNATEASDKYIRPIIDGRVAFRPISNDPEIIALIYELKELNSAKQHLMSMVKFYELLSLLYTRCADVALPQAGSDIDIILDYIEKNYSKKLTTSSICKKFGYNETYFCRKFKQKTGISVTRYILLLRLEQACRLIQETNKAIGVISTTCGFSDFSYFCASFKRIYGLSPTEYKARITQAASSN